MKFFKTTLIALALGTIGSTLVTAEEVGDKEDGEDRWTFGITPGVFVPSESDFDSKAVFSIGGQAYYRLEKDRAIEVEGHYANLDLKGSSLPTGAFDTDSARWAFGVNHIWWQDKEEIQGEGWYWGVGLHYENYDLPGSYLNGSGDSDGAAGKLLVGYQIADEWSAQAAYMFSGSDGHKQLNNDEFDRNGFEFQVNYHFR